MVSYVSSDGNDSQTESLYSQEIFEGTISKPILAIAYQKPKEQSVKTVALSSVSYLSDKVINSDNSKAYFYGYSSDKEQYHISEIVLESLEVTHLTYLNSEHSLSNLTLYKDEQSLYMVLH